MSVTIRAARPEDRDCLVRFINALNRHEAETRKDRDTTLEGAAQHLASMKDDIREKGGFILIAEMDGAPAGYIVGLSEIEDGAYVRPDQRPFGCILDIYVAAEARGQGVSRAMIDAAAQRFRDMGLPRILVTGLASNPLASAAYPALGFDVLYNTYEMRIDN